MILKNVKSASFAAFLVILVIIAIIVIANLTVGERAGQNLLMYPGGFSEEISIYFPFQNEKKFYAISLTFQEAVMINANTLIGVSHPDKSDFSNAELVFYNLSTSEKQVICSGEDLCQLIKKAFNNEKIEIEEINDLTGIDGFKQIDSQWLFFTYHDTSLFVFNILSWDLRLLSASLSSDFVVTKERVFFSETNSAGELTNCSIDFITEERMFYPLSCEIISISPDEKSYAYYEKGAIYLIDLQSGKKKHWGIEGDQIWGLSFSDDSRFLACFTHGGTIFDDFAGYTNIEVMEISTGFHRTYKTPFPPDSFFKLLWINM